MESAKRLHLPVGEGTRRCQLGSVASGSRSAGTPREEVSSKNAPGSSLFPPRTDALELVSQRAGDACPTCAQCDAGILTGEACPLFFLREAPISSHVKRRHRKKSYSERGVLNKNAGTFRVRPDAPRPAASCPKAHSAHGAPVWGSQAAKTARAPPRSTQAVRRSCVSCPRRRGGSRSRRNAQAARWIRPSSARALGSTSAPRQTSSV